MDKDALIVGGFVFPSYKEAQNAIKEQKNIESIRQKMPMSDRNAVYKIYTKLIESNMFHTMVGYSFLYELRSKLIFEFGYDESELQNVILPKQMDYDIVTKKNKEILDEKVSRLLVIKKRMSIVIAALLVMIVAMFVIAVINPNAHYVDVENKVLNRYASWEEELDLREQEIKAKEAELNIDSGK